MNKEIIPFEYSTGISQAFGVTKVPNGVQFSVYLLHCSKCFLKLYKQGKKTPAATIELDEKYRMGSAYFIVVKKAKGVTDERNIWEILEQDYEYLYEADGAEFVDPYADFITGREHWGQKSEDPKRAGICLQEFDWGDDSPLRTPYSNLILYQLHVRGYTKHNSSKVKHKGTFLGLQEKISYLSDLGINGVLLLPVYEFSEIAEKEKLPILVPEEKKEADAEEETEYKINFWGYGTEDTYYFAPKAAYASNKQNPSEEFQALVKAFHKAGIEVLLDIYFAPGTNLFLMTDCLRNWVIKYHVDGFRVNQDVMPSLTLASDPILSGVKILGNYWDMGLLHQAMISGQKNSLAEYNDGYMNEARKFLKSDEGMVERMVHYFSRNSGEYSFINFITNVNGFTLMDLVSYDIKHNEENGESNRDGTEYNYSWNCGFEGKTRKKNILNRRMVQLRNALLMLMTSQGTPMLLAGDELGNTQFGNNNPYCQDNQVTWIQWSRSAMAKMLHEYTKNLIRFRKCFKVLRQDKPLRMMDYLSCGLPDLSIHGTEAWRADFSNYSRMLGMLYYGGYVARGKGRSIYILYNMYWEAKSFDLPDLPRGHGWKVVIDTYDNNFDATQLYEEKKPDKRIPRRKKPQAKLIRKTVVAPRSIVVFVED